MVCQLHLCTLCTLPNAVLPQAEISQLGGWEHALLSPVIVDFIYVDSPCFAHVLSNTRLETTNFEPCSFRFCKFETSLLNKASFCTKQFTGGFINVDLYMFTSMLDERIQIYKKIHVIVASVAQGPPCSSKKKHHLQFFFTASDGCRMVVQQYHHTEPYF